MATLASPERFSSFPMGPKLRTYLGVTDADYRGGESPQRTDADERALTEFLRGWHGQRERPSDEAIVDLLDELVTMDMPEAVLDLAAQWPEAVRDFRAQLATAVAAMLTGDLATAESRFRAAQELIPEEPAPYVNLAQIFLNQGRTEEAEVWVLAGLDAEPNNFALWDLMATVLSETQGEMMPDYLMALAEKRISWAGLSLAANLTSTGDRYLKANLLERLYHQGERDAQFLVELTGAHGIAGDFAKIPPLVWQAERLASKGLPWQLHVHCAQAQLSMNEPEAALGQIAKARKTEHLPDGVSEGLDELEAEAHEAQRLLGTKH